ncbi:MAG: GNAT family N-acetyltransferase [Bacillota bacterium]
MSDPKDELVFQEGGVEILDLIAPLWQQLNRHHQAISEHFGQAIAQMTFDMRRAGLVEKAMQGLLRVDLAKIETGMPVAYCVSTIDAQQTGEVDSIFVQPQFRGQGIGDRLMRRALRWLDGQGAQSKIVVVAWGNEGVLTFYRRYGFFPRNLTLKQMPSVEPSAMN